jgi:hypothetical protein
MVPLDQKSATVTVQVTGTSGSVTLSEPSHSSTACTGCPAGVGTATDFAHELQLTVVDTSVTPNRKYYSGALDALSSTTICGIGSGCPNWAVNETHNFTFTVLFPAKGAAIDNLYQGTGATATFQWARS